MITLHPIFRDGAILQAEKPVRVFGKAEGKITVSVGADKQSITANGEFLLEFPARPYGDSCEITATQGKEKIVVRDIVFGDIFLVAGQSNMQFKLSEGTPDGKIYECDEIRLFSPHRIEKNEHFTPDDGWVKCNESTAPFFSAVGYFVARDYNKLTGKAVGLISCYQGASAIQSWIPEEVLREDELYDIWDDGRNFDIHNQDYSSWGAHGKLYDYALCQIAPFPMKAVLWYQGESNTVIKEALVYDKALKRMVECFREELNDEKLPFVIVQIADYDNRDDEAWREIQRAQERAVGIIPFSYLVKSADVCEKDNIHPPTKHLLAKRIVNKLL